MIEPHKIEALEKEISYRFKNRELLTEAFTHKSFANERRSLNLKDYERLEFLGDAILDFAISDLLFKEFPDISEGELSKKRADIVREESLCRIGKSLNLGEYMLLGRGEVLSGGNEKRSLIANVTESLIASIYLDGGIQEACKFVTDTFAELIVTPLETTDYKSKLQELWQKKHKLAPIYRVMEESGPDHDKEFKIVLELDGKVLSYGTGKSIKEAEQEAAKKSLDLISP